MASDLEALIDMGFEKARAELAVKKTGGRTYIDLPLCADNGPLTRLAVQGALQWLEDNQDKSLEDIEAAEAAKAADADEDEDETKAKIAELESGQDARSLVCNDCGKRFRNQALASYHASKT